MLVGTGLDTRLVGITTVVIIRVVRVSISLHTRVVSVAAVIIEWLVFSISLHIRVVSVTTVIIG